MKFDEFADNGNPIRRTNIHSWQPEGFQAVEDLLAREVPMEIQVAAWDGDFHPVAVTMRTPGFDVELALGFLLTEGVIQSMDQVAFSRRCHDNLGIQNVVQIGLAEGVAFDLERLSRHVFTSSSCGVCGKQTIDRILAQGLVNPSLSRRLDPLVLTGLPDQLAREQDVFRQTGGLHAAALFDLEGHLLRYREDVGRHNALDKLIGSMIRDRLLPATDRILLLSGRAGFELIQKAVFAGIPIVAGIGAPSSLAVTLASQFNLALVGFLRARRFNLYTAGPEIFDLP